MNNYRADLHIHSVLSPCGDLEMSPVNIINRAAALKLDVIGITDHNSTLHGPLLRQLGQEQDIFVLTGAEVTTREEVHCLTFFENDELLGQFQHYLDSHLPFIKNKPKLFGYQVVVDRFDNILNEIEPLLINGIDQSLEQVEMKVRELGGIFIPAHVDKQRFSLLSNLGFLPQGLNPDAIEISNHSNRIQFLKDNRDFEKYTILINSDAHQLEQIGRHTNVLSMQHADFKEIKMVLHNLNGRKVKYV